MQPRPTMLSSHRRPLRIEAATLDVRDLARVRDFYLEALGLELVREADDQVDLGSGGAAFLTLQAAPDAQSDDPRLPGLFHIAFLLPDRAALGGWLRHARQTGVALDGAADHAVSEAVYLHDPEGNGVEIYADRPERAWKRRDGRFELPNDPLNTADLDRVAEPWAGFPAGGAIGHVHLRAANALRAAERYQALLGLDLMAELPQARFLGSGGYHHHLAVNSWRSAGAAERGAGRAGLAEIRFSAAPALFAALAGSDAEAALLQWPDPAAGRIVVAPRPEDGSEAS